MNKLVILTIWMLIILVIVEALAIMNLLGRVIILEDHIESIKISLDILLDEQLLWFQP